MILYAAADLLWATKIKATADALGIPCRPARNPDMLHARLAEGAVRALLVDLDKGPDALELIALARAHDPARGVRVVAWGPHVDKALLQAARDAGAHEVLTRGSMDHNLEQILISLAGSTSPPHAT